VLYLNYLKRYIIVNKSNVHIVAYVNTQFGYKVTFFFIRIRVEVGWASHRSIKL